MFEIRSTLPGVVVRLPVPVGGAVAPSTVVAVVESMKMEYEVVAETSGVLSAVVVTDGDQVVVGDVLATVSPAPAPAPAPAADTGRGEPAGGAASPAPEVGSGWPHPGDRGRADRAGGARADLAEVRERHAAGLDAARPDAVAKRHGHGLRTARENLADLVDAGSFVEFGPLVLAAQRARRSVAELVERTPADGLVAGVGRVDGRPTAVASYDYMVLAGTQGYHNHRKKDRLFEVVERQRLPLVIFAEGGGGRPGDTDVPVVSGLDVLAFHLFARLSGLVPLVGIVAGRCFAGNAALAGCCDVIIGVDGANLGMGGPAMIEGGGLGTFAPGDVGPLAEQVANGVVDVAVPDEAAAVAAARRYLAFFARAERGGAVFDGTGADGTGDDGTGAGGTGDDGRAARPAAPWTAPDPDVARSVVPENRRQAYDVHAALDAVVDVGSALELRAGFAPGMVTALARVEGRPLGVVANNPMHLAGAIDAVGADKAARFLQLCDAHDLPVLFLCDTPGFMVGPEAERMGLVRHVSRLFVTGANLSVPFGTIILRKAYGLGAQAMAGGSFKAPLFCVAWPTGELGGMGLEGAVRLGFRRELAAIADDAEREQAFEAMVAAAYERGRALNTASLFEIDDVIDPAESRRWVTTVLFAGVDAAPRPGGKRPYIDTW
jgi:acetyl-CoA carboxylase carboxyltransferase component